MSASLSGDLVARFAEIEAVIERRARLLAENERLRERVRELQMRFCEVEGGLGVLEALCVENGPDSHAVSTIV